MVVGMDSARSDTLFCTSVAVWRIFCESQIENEGIRARYLHESVNLRLDIVHGCRLSFALAEEFLLLVQKLSVPLVQSRCGFRACTCVRHQADSPLPLEQLEAETAEHESVLIVKDLWRARFLGSKLDKLFERIQGDVLVIGAADAIHENARMAKESWQLTRTGGTFLFHARDASSRRGSSGDQGVSGPCHGEHLQ